MEGQIGTCIVMTPECGQAEVWTRSQLSKEEEVLLQEAAWERDLRSVKQFSSGPVQ